jgi:hypothetical protein
MSCVAILRRSNGIFGKPNCAWEAKIAETHAKIAETNGRIAESKAELTRWVVGVGVLQTTLIIGVLMKVAKLI